jgi:hypothetical protein
MTAEEDGFPQHRLRSQVSLIDQRRTEVWAARVGRGLPPRPEADASAAPRRRRRRLDQLLSQARRTAANGQPNTAVAVTFAVTKAHTENSEGS